MSIFEVIFLRLEFLGKSNTSENESEIVVWSDYPSKFFFIKILL